MLLQIMKTEHSAHCRACKQRVGELLIAIYGGCHANRQFPWSARPEDYTNTFVGGSLRRIHTALAAWRDHGDFIKSSLMPPCDFVVSDPPFILEFDESQHFTHAREITLALYPETIPLGFSLARWRGLCRSIDARDDEPVDRDAVTDVHGAASVEGGI